MAELALESLRPGVTLPDGARLAVSRMGGADVEVPSWATVGLGRQDELLTHADLVICGGGHGMVTKTLLAGVPMVVVPGGGDQWEIANRLVRQGSAQLVRPLKADALTAAVGEVLGSPKYRRAAQSSPARRSERNKVRREQSWRHVRKRPRAHPRDPAPMPLLRPGFPRFPRPAARLGGVV